MSELDIENVNKHLQDDEKKLGDNMKLFRRIGISLPFILLIIYFSWFIYNKIPVSKDSSDWGTLGDFVGGLLNPIFALMAFYWLTRSIELQLREMRETRAAFELSASEQEKSARAQEQLVNEQKKATDAQISAAKEQQKQSKIQSFENLFFALLTQKNEITNDIRAGSESSLKICAKYEKIKPNEHKYKFINDKIKDLKGSGLRPNTGKESIKDHMIFFKSFSYENWLGFYNECLEDYFSSYFRISYQILKIIDDDVCLSEKPVTIKRFFSLLGLITTPTANDCNNVMSHRTKPTIMQKKYADIFRATLSPYEIEAIFFNSLCEHGLTKFKPLIEKYGFFEHLSIDTTNPMEVKNRLVHIAYKYDRSAFENNKEWMTYFDEIEDKQKGGLARMKYGICEQEYQNYIQ